MKIHPAQQGTQAWIEARCSIPTASEFSELLTPKFEIRTGEMPKTYLARKLAEKWGGPLPVKPTFEMEQGNVLEDFALPFFTFKTDLEVNRVGLCLTDDERVGCSPDGLIGDNGGLECKCPAAQTHVKYLLNEVLPPEYATQVHGSMYVTGRPFWYFMSFRRNFPPLILKIERDEKIQAKIGEALAGFLKTFDEEFERMVEMNNGVLPPKREPIVFASDIKQDYKSQEPT
jgi:hypothetical protein